MPPSAASASNRPLRIIFAGTPEFAAIHLGALIASEHEVVAVYTQPDRPAGRGKKLHASPVKQMAQAADLPVRQPASLRDAGAQQSLSALAADIMVVVAYGLILPQAVLDAPRLGCLNVHASLLPRWRGAAPIQRAIAAGDTATGITIMQMDAGLDTGAMLATVECGIDERTTAANLLDRLGELGPPLLLQVLRNLPDFQRKATAQNNDLATYAGKILKPEAAIDWRQDAATLDRLIRAFNPFPVCFSTLGEVRVKVWQARIADQPASPEPPGTILAANRDGILVSCGDQPLLIQCLQLPGGKPLPAEQVLHARSELFAPGSGFGLPAGSDS